jgi:hypothetical protein
MEYLIKVSSILVLFFACYKLFLNRETFFESNRSFLLIGIASSFLLPLITITNYIEVEPVITESAIAFGEGISQSVAVDNSISVTTLLAYIYLAGILFFLIRFLVQFGSLLILFIKSTKQRVASYIYVITQNALSPFSFFNWIVFNPEHFNETELEQIITHEKVHAKQLHSIDILLAELTSVVLWFNPFIWLYKKDLRQNLEFIADNNVQAITKCKKSYQHLLLKTSVPNYDLALTNNFYNSLIKKRIVMLHKDRSNNRNQLKFLLILPALAIFLMSFNTKEIYIEKVSYTKSSSSVSDLNDLESTTTESYALAENTITTTPQKTQSKVDLEETKKSSNQDIVTYFIESTFTDAQLDDIITKFKSQGIILKIKSVKRNSDKEITGLKIDAKSDRASANFSIDNDTAIKTIRITYNAKDSSISIGNTNNLLHDTDYEYTHEDGVFTIDKLSDKDSNVFVYSNDNKHDDKPEVIEEDGKIMIKSKGKVHELKKTNKDKNVFVISDGSNISKQKDDTKYSYIIKKDKKEKSLNEWKDNDDTIFILNDDDNIFIEKTGKGKDKLILSGANDNALFIIDDKEVIKKDFDNLDTNNIATINIFKGDSATEKYGDKGKNGVIVITTKKKKN